MPMIMELSATEISQVDYHAATGFWSESYTNLMQTFARKRVEVANAGAAWGAFCEFAKEMEGTGRCLRIMARKRDGRQVAGLKDREWWERGVAVNRKAVATPAALAAMLAAEAAIEAARGGV